MTTIPTSPLRQTSPNGLAGSKSLNTKRMRATSPLRQGNHRGSVSPKTARLLKLYDDDTHVRLRETSASAYLARVNFFVSWLDDRGLDMISVREDDLLAYQTMLLGMRKKNGRPFSVGSHVNYILAVRSLYRFLYRRRYILHNPSAALDLPRRERRLPRTLLTPDEVRKIVEATGTDARGLRDRAIFETLYATGIRCGELVRLTPYDVDTEERTLRVIQGKGGKDRHVPLTKVAAVAIERYLTRARPRLLGRRSAPGLFVGERRPRLHQTRVGQCLRRLLAKAGIKKHVTPHTFRHSIATHLLRGRADIRHIQTLLGHSCLSSTERYVKVELSDLKEVIRRAHPRGR